MGDDIYCMPANTKYPDVLDPVREEAKAERRSIMGKFAKYFAPHTAQDRSAYEPNVFSYNLRDPVKPNARDPRFLVCHMCGGGFGPDSLELHFKTCEDKWNAREDQREPGEPSLDIPSKPSVTPADPKNWTRAEVDEYNKQATEAYLENALFQCEKCGRKFNEESFAAHFNGCDKVGGANPKVRPCNLCGKILFGDEHALYHKRKCRCNFWDLPTGRREIGPACYVCGKECSAKSLDRHVAMCEKQWEARELNKMYPDDRLPLPSKIGGSGGWEAQKQAMLGCGAMKSCENCGKAFMAESYEKHIKGCGQEQTIENFLKQQKNKTRKRELVLGCEDGYFRKYNPKPSENGVCCYICGRKFGHSSIDIHVKACIHLWEEKERSKSDREEKRPVPPRPSEFDTFKANGMSLSAWNKWVFENCALYVPCKNCNRTFLPEQLAKHRRGCKPQGAPAEWR
mmetsp:Transcript_18784/g.46978  ORF Transcript_18784/g.46978 Transcript_18784/m.46978 type:complete len:455 (+) Transcript_18784:546-1910(+)